MSGIRGQAAIGAGAGPKPGPKPDSRALAGIDDDPNVRLSDILYILSLDINSRSHGDRPIATIRMDGDVIAGPGAPFPAYIQPVGGAEPWYHFDIPFMATDSELTLSIDSIAANVADPFGDATLLIDNVTITGGAIPEPTSTITWAVLGLAACFYSARGRRVRSAGRSA